MFTQTSARFLQALVISTLIVATSSIITAVRLPSAATSNDAQSAQSVHKSASLQPSSSSSLQANALNAQQLQQQQQPYFGALIGELSNRKHNVSGTVFAVDEQTLFIRAFNFDGQALDAYFWSSVSEVSPSGENAFIVPDEKGSTKPLELYINKDIVLRLPEGRTLREIRWLSVWSRHSRLSLGDVQILAHSISIPRPVELGPFTQLAHDLKSGPITIVDAQTFLVADLHYDGLGPTAFFYLSRGGSSLNGNSAAGALKLRDENGASATLRKYSGETVVVSLPDNYTIYDFDHFGIWCQRFAVSFGSTRIAHAPRVPPSPRMLGIKPENKLNCEILYDDLGFEVRWVLDGDDIVMQLVGKIEQNEFMAFGLGKDDSQSDLSNADAVVAWVDRQSGQVHAADYFFGSCTPQTNSNNQATATTAATEKHLLGCADTRLNGGSDSLTLLHGAIVNGYSMITFKRPQLGIDDAYDQHVYSDGQQSVVWAIGTLSARNELERSKLATRGNMFIDFARNPHWNCPVPDLNASMASTGVATSNPQASTVTGGAQVSTNQHVTPLSLASHVDSTVIESNRFDQTEPGLRQPQDFELQTNNNVATTSQSTTSQLINQSLPNASTQQQQQQQQHQQQHSNLNSNTRQLPTAAAASTSSDRNWYVPAIVCPSDRTFRAQLGPAAGRKAQLPLIAAGRPQLNWPAFSNVWYINGLLLPELVVERGVSYKFIVEGGNDKTRFERRHPFYITDSNDGGFDFKTDSERESERVFAGVGVRNSDGQFVPTAEGRLCEWRPTNATPADPDSLVTFGQFQRTLKLECANNGQPASFRFTPDSSTPSQLYYQCYTHRHFGWKIRVVDSCVGYLRSLLAQQQQQQQPNGSASSVNKPTFQQ